MPKFPIDVLRPQLGDIFKDRWRIPDWKLHFPWWRPPADCRILMYADGPVQLSGGGFQGLTYVKTLLESHAYYYVKFIVDVCHRRSNLFDESSGGLRQGHTACCAVKQPGTESRFQARHRVAHRRGRHVQLDCGGTERPSPAYRQRHL